MAGPASQPAQLADARPVDTRVTALVQAIRQAPDPSSAIQAYHDASAFAASDVAVEQAYVARMVDFGLPEMADAQAQDVIRHNPRDGVAWAVSAYMNAKRDQNDVALQDIALAVKFQPDNAFVVRTAGQVIAWYDTNADKSRIPDDLRAAIAPIRTQLAANPTYTDAYNRASETYRQLAAAAPTTQPTDTTPWVSTYTYRPSSRGATTTDTGAEEVTPPAYTPPPATYNTYNYDYSYPSYPDYSYPSPYAAYPAYNYWWPGPVWGASWWWPTFSSVVIVDKNVSHCNRHAFHDCFNKGNAFFAHHSNNFAFARNGHHGAFVNNHGRFVGDARSGSHGTALANGTTMRREFVPSQNRPGGGQVIGPGGSRVNTMGRGTAIAPTRQTPAFSGSGGGRHFTPSPSRVAPAAAPPARVGRPAPAAPGRPPMSAPRSPSFGGGSHVVGGGGGGGAHFGGGGGHSGGGGGGHFVGGGGGGGGGGGHGGR